MLQCGNTSPIPGRASRSRSSAAAEANYCCTTYLREQALIQRTAAALETTMRGGAMEADKDWARSTWNWCCSRYSLRHWGVAPAYAAACAPQNWTCIFSPGTRQGVSSAKVARAARAAHASAASPGARRCS